MRGGQHVRSAVGGSGTADAVVVAPDRAVGQGHRDTDAVGKHAEHHGGAHRHVHVVLTGEPHPVQSVFGDDAPGRAAARGGRVHGQVKGGRTARGGGEGVLARLGGRGRAQVERADDRGTVGAPDLIGAALDRGEHHRLPGGHRKGARTAARSPVDRVPGNEAAQRAADTAAHREVDRGLAALRGGQQVRPAVGGSGTADAIVVAPDRAVGQGHRDTDAVGKHAEHHGGAHRHVHVVLTGEPDPVQTVFGDDAAGGTVARGGRVHGQVKGGRTARSGGEGIAARLGGRGAAKVERADDRGTVGAPDLIGAPLDRGEHHRLPGGHRKGARAAARSPVDRVPGNEAARGAAARGGRVHGQVKGGRYSPWRW